MNKKIEILKKLTEWNIGVLSRPIPHISPRELYTLASIMQLKQAAKGEVILKEGEVLQDIIIIESGLVRQFYFKKGIDITEHFACEGKYLVCIESLLRKMPTTLMVEALEPTSYYTIRYSELEKLFEKSYALLNLYRYFVEVNLVYSQYKADSMRFVSSLERYANFLKQYPQAAKRASVKHIASFLLMTPESLSRVRSKLSHKK